MVILYDADASDEPSQGAVYRVRPVFWIEPPLTVLRNPNFHARTYRFFAGEDAWPVGAFKQALDDNQECVIARAKLRFVVVLSPDFDIRQRATRELVVAPLYSMPSSADFSQRIRDGDVPQWFYVPQDETYTTIREGFINFRMVQPLIREFFTPDRKEPYRLNDVFRSALLSRYRDYFVTVR